MSDSPPPRRVEDHTPGSYAYAAAEWKHKAEEASKEIARLRQEIEEARQSIQERHDLAMENANEWAAWRTHAREVEAENEKLRAALREVEATKSGRR